MRHIVKPIIALSILPQFLLVKFIAQYPQFIETYYSNGLYPFISKIFRYVLGWLPFSFGDIVYTLASVLAIRWFIVNRRRIIKAPKSWTTDVLTALSIFYFAFHFLWGMNYYRPPLHENLNLNADYTTEELVTTTTSLIKLANRAHYEITNNDSQAVNMPYNKPDILKKSALGYKELQKIFPHLEYHPVSIKKSIYSLPLTYMGFSGYLNPFTNEGQVDGLIPAYKMPTTSSHEIAHQLGYAAENEANFIGCMAAINHPDTYFRYSGLIFGLRHCLNELYVRDENLYNKLVKNVNIGILKNYEEGRLFWDSYQNPVEPIFKKTYDGYLQANNQTDGMKSYSYVVALLVNYIQKKGL